METTTEPILARHTKFIVFILILLSVGITTLAIYYHQLTQPTKASVVVTTPLQNSTATLTITPKSYTNVYASFNYPSIMSTYPVLPFTQPTLAVASFSYPDTQTWILNIGILKIPSGNLIDNGDYVLRINNPTIYELNETTVNGVQIPVMIDTTSQSFNKVAFLVNGQYQAEISLIGADSSGNTLLDNSLQMVLSSWQWQN